MANSFRQTARKFQMTALSLARIEEEGRAIIADAASSEPAKVVARKIGKTPRHVRNLANGDCETGWSTFMAMALHYPSVNAFVCRVLAMEQRDPRTEELLEKMRAWMASQPEAGDQAQPGDE